MSEFVEYLHEVFEQFGQIQARRMFGGYGIYHDGLMFGLVVDDSLYLKTDETTAEEFRSRGLEHFSYEKGGKLVKLSYYLAPEEVVDNPRAAALWARRAYEAALRARSDRIRTTKK